MTITNRSIISTIKIFLLGIMLFMPFTCFSQDLKRHNPDYLPSNISSSKANCNSQKSSISEFDSIFIKGEYDSLLINSKDSNYSNPIDSIIYSTDSYFKNAPNLKIRIGDPKPDLSTNQIQKINLQDEILPYCDGHSQKLLNPANKDIPDALPDYSIDKKGIIKDMDTHINSQAANLDELKLLNHHQNVDEQLIGPNPSSSLPGVQNDITLKKVKEQVSEEYKAKLLEHQDKIKVSKNKLLKYKKNYPEAESIKDIQEHNANPIKDKPISERFVPGIMFHFQNNVSFNIDLDPHLFYILNNYISIGVGGRYQVRVQENTKPYVSNPQKIYGGRLFVEYNIIKSFYLHTEWERLYYSSSSSLLPNSKLSTSGFPLGIGKKYKLFGRLEGNTQLLYYLPLKEESLYQRNLLIRTGFNFLIKTRSK